MREKWGSLRAVADGLHLGAERPGSSWPIARFAADALVLNYGDRVERLAWDDGDGADEAGGRPCKRRWALVTHTGGPREAGYVAIVRYQSMAGLKSSLELQFGGEVTKIEHAVGIAHHAPLAPLTAALADRPNLRPGVEDSTKSWALVDSLASGAWKRPRGPHEPLAGSKLHAYIAARRALCDERIVFGGRLIAGDVVPSVDQLLARARAWDRSNPASDDLISDALEHFVNAGRWPFDVLAS